MIAILALVFLSIFQVYGYQQEMWILLKNGTSYSTSQRNKNADLTQASKICVKGKWVFYNQTKYGSSVSPSDVQIYLFESEDLTGSQFTCSGFNDLFKWDPKSYRFLGAKDTNDFRIDAFTSPNFIGNSISSTTSSTSARIDPPLTEIRSLAITGLNSINSTLALCTANNTNPPFCAVLNRRICVTYDHSIGSSYAFKNINFPSSSTFNFISKNPSDLICNNLMYYPI